MGTTNSATFSPSFGGGSDSFSSSPSSSPYKTNATGTPTTSTPTLSTPPSCSKRSQPTSQSTTPPQGGKMTFKDYAYYLLKREGKPLRVEHIVNMGLSEGLYFSVPVARIILTRDRTHFDTKQDARHCPCCHSLQCHQVHQTVAFRKGGANDLWTY